jgi:hypothetical protein
VDPFEAYDEFSAPARGSRYVMVDVTIANTGNQLLSTSPNDFIATDDQGFLLQPAFVTSTDPSLVNFDYIDLNPGEEQRGVIYYQLFANIPLEQIVYGDGYTRDIVVADLAAGVPAPPSPVVAVTTTAVASSPDCEGLVEWGRDVEARIASAAALTAGFEENPLNLDPTTLREAANQMLTFAQEQRDSNPPPAAVTLNTFLAEEFYSVLATSLTDLAAAIEAGNSAQALLVVANAEELIAVFDGGGQAGVLLDELEAACPNEIEQLST